MRLKICRFLACYLVFPFMWPFSTSILFPSPSISFVCCWFIVLQYIQQTAQRGTDLGQNVFCRHANGRLPVYLLFSLKLLCAAYSDAVESGLKKQRLLHSSSLWNLEERRRKAKGDFQSQWIRHVYDVIFLSTQMLKGCIQNACFMPISNLFAPFVTIQLSVQQMKRITQINNRLWLASISLQVNRAVYKHSHQNLIHFFLCNFAPVLVLLSAFLNNVHSVCPCSNSFVVVD